MLGMMATNNLAESSFAGVTAMIQTHGRIGLNSAAAFSDTKRNNFLYRPTNKNAMAKKKRSVSHAARRIVVHSYHVSHGDCT